jgi:erythromycin esterase-like protein
MWRNAEMRALVDWLREHNRGVPEPRKQVGFHGLDIYGLAASTDNVVEHLRTRDPEAAAVARRHYACLAPYRDDPTDYARDTLRPGFDNCEREASAAVKLVEGRQTPAADPAVFEALQNARSALGGERYYRTMAGGAVSSWNLRDQYMFDTLLQVLEARGPDAKAVVWAHNSHVGNAAATEMGRRGEHNIGQLCRGHFGEAARLVGFGTDRGTVMAARAWGGDPEVMEVRPSLQESYGALFRDAGRSAFMLDLRPGIHDSLRGALRAERIDRAIGVMYLPRSERVSHYFKVSLPDQFDAYLWFDQTRAVTPIRDGEASLGTDHPLSG